MPSDFAEVLSSAETGAGSDRKWGFPSVVRDMPKRRSIPDIVDSHFNDASLFALAGSLDLSKIDAILRSEQDLSTATANLDGLWRTSSNVAQMNNMPTIYQQLSTPDDCVNEMDLNFWAQSDNSVGGTVPQLGLPSDASPQWWDDSTAFLFSDGGLAVGPSDQNSNTTTGVTDVPQTPKQPEQLCNGDSPDGSSSKSSTPPHSERDSHTTVIKAFVDNSAHGTAMNDHGTVMNSFVPYNNCNSNNISNNNNNNNNNSIGMMQPSMGMGWMWNGVSPQNASAMQEVSAAALYQGYGAPYQMEWGHLAAQQQQQQLAAMSNPYAQVQFASYQLDPSTWLAIQQQQQYSAAVNAQRQITLLNALHSQHLHSNMFTSPSQQAVSRSRNPSPMSLAGVIDPSLSKSKHPGFFPNVEHTSDSSHMQTSVPSMPISTPSSKTQEPVRRTSPVQPTEQPVSPTPISSPVSSTQLLLETPINAQFFPAMEPSNDMPAPLLGNGKRNSSKSLTLQILSKHFSQPIQSAAVKLGVSARTLKKVCRQFGIDRWPYRKLQMLDRNIQRLQQTALDLPSTERSRVVGEVSRFEDLQQQRLSDPSNPSATRAALLANLAAAASAATGGMIPSSLASSLVIPGPRKTIAKSSSFNSIVHALRMVHTNTSPLPSPAESAFSTSPTSTPTTPPQFFPISQQAI
eukprot:CAMPEP_0184658304 /NCGR_PEP_ID=MMETSP0308-20130426/24806_1 /TAXON_ID=38269 /ORGANISM="Gloeochaete witrockiana, Strain SAG 46.84" /LENGTH=684 /DNA_ID=CAMNT_0027097201 /DNA_START=107 /DNA_END=2161 /DNA_ORIENTATION=+